ncbi:MAG: hypothetical protein OQJ84_12920, partial [Xanthomonadales bacterium]|nr:hypothetical protein [Xanthomonadales bacterium]
MNQIKGLAFLLAMVLAISNASNAQAQSPNANPQAFGKGYPLQATHLPASELRDRLLALDPHARARAMKILKDLAFTSLDLAYIKVDLNGDIYFADDFGPEPAEDAYLPMLPPVGAALTEAETFLLHSRPGAPNVIYLDFNGHTISGTAWNSNYGVTTYYARAYDPDGDDVPPYSANADCTSPPPSVTVNFSANELAIIHQIWHRIAEDYAPFDVDVTTEEPAIIDRYTGRILFTDNYDYCGIAMPSVSAGGVAYVGPWGQSNYHTYYSPALVYNSSLIGAAEAGSHEMGHNLS